MPQHDTIWTAFFQTPDGTVKLEHYAVLLRHDLNAKTGLRVVPKLTEKHIHPNNFQKMSVRLAAQVTLDFSMILQIITRCAITTVFVMKLIIHNSY